MKNYVNLNKENRVSVPYEIFFSLLGEQGPEKFVSHCATLINL